MAVRHDRRSFREADELAYSLWRSRTSRPLEQLADVEVPRARDVALARIALVAAAARVLVRRPHVEDRQRRIVEPACKVLPRRECLRISLEIGLYLPHVIELDRALVELALPTGDAAEEDRHLRMARELGHLRGRHRADAVAAIDEHEALAARDSVPPQA